MLESVKRFKNGNMNVKMDRDLYCENETALINLLWVLEEKDCTILGEEFCIGCYDIGLYVYSYYTGKKYLISFNDVENIYAAGKTLKLYAENLDRDDIEILESGEN